MSWYECPKCGRELTSDQAYFGRCKYCGDVVVRLRGLNEGPLDLNKATMLELHRIVGFGSTTALRIVQYREHHKRFESVEDVRKVRGVGKQTYEKVKDKVYV